MFSERWAPRSRAAAGAGICAVMLAAIAPATALAAWTSTGGPLNVSPARNAQDPASATIGGVPYVAWREQDGSGVFQVYVKHWNGTSWTQDGGSLNVSSSDNVDGPSLADVGGVPYVTWSEHVGSGPAQVYVKHWTGSAWVENGGALNVSPSQPAVVPWITAVAGVPYVAFQENIGGSPPPTVYVEHWNGTAWVQDGSSGVSAVPTDNNEVPSIADVGGVPYVAFEDETTFKVYVAHFAAGTWTLDGGALNANPANAAVQPTIATVGGTPYVAWQESPSVYVAHWDGANWIHDGGALPTHAGATTFVQALAGAGGGPLVALTEGTLGTEDVEVERLRGMTWEQVGDAVVHGTAISTLQSLTSVGGVPFVAWLQLPQGASQPQVFAADLTPDFSSEQALASDTGALLTARVRDSGAQLPIAFQYGVGPELTATTSSQLTDGTGSSTIVQAISGLSPATGYSWRAIGTDGTSATAFSTTSTFTTEALNGPGPAGAQGPAGPQGPAGKVELVTCKTITKTVFRRVHGRRRAQKVHVQSCTTKLVDGPVSFTVSSARTARLTRGRTLYATVEVLSTPRTLRMIVVHRVRALRPGSYTLTVGAARRTIEIR